MDYTDKEATPNQLVYVRGEGGGNFNNQKLTASNWNDNNHWNNNNNNKYNAANDNDV